MKFMFPQNYAVECVEPMNTWVPEDIKAHFDFVTTQAARLHESRAAGPRR